MFYVQCGTKRYLVGTVFRGVGGLAHGDELVGAPLGPRRRGSKRPDTWRRAVEHSAALQNTDCYVRIYRAVGAHDLVYSSYIATIWTTGCTAVYLWCEI